MGLAVPFDLGGLVERFPAGAIFRIFAVDPLAGERLHNRKHAAIAEIAVMRECQNLGAGLLLAHRHPFPEVTWIGASKRRLGGEWLDQTGLGAIVAPDHVTMEIVSAGIPGPCVADERREAAGIVSLLRRLDRLAPC